jgi:hypothetical protein
MAKTAKTLGSLRRVDCVEAEVVLASGVYLVFRLDTAKSAEVRNVIEVSRTRMGARPRESIQIDSVTYLAVKRGVLEAILAHRAKMHLPPPAPRVIPVGGGHQYRLPLV